MTASSDGTGMVYFENLEPGDYILQETRAPEHHELDKTELQVSSRTHYDELFPTLGLLALVCLLAEALLRLLMRRLP